MIQFQQRQLNVSNMFGEISLTPYLKLLELNPHQLTRSKIWRFKEATDIHTPDPFFCLFSSRE